MIPVGRMGDMTIGICLLDRNTVTGTIFPNPSSVFINSLPAGRMGDMVITSCGHVGIIAMGSPTVMAGSLPLARMGDLVTGNYIGTIIQGSATVLSK
jgi:uncharacterized Zn-binding protein involved in type VI secretion